MEKDQTVESNQTAVRTPSTQTEDKDFYLPSKHENGSDIASVKSLDEKSDISLDYAMLGRLNKSGHSSISSFSDVAALDIEPKLGKSEHEHDVSALMADAQKDVIFSTDGSVVSKDPSQTQQQQQSWVTSVRKDSEFEDIDSREVQFEHDGSSESNSPLLKDGVPGSPDISSKEACVLFHDIIYLGSAGVNAPVSEIELKRTISIMREHAAVSFDIVLAIGLCENSTIRLIDPFSRTDIATYLTEKIIFWGKADDDSREKDCVAFNVSHVDESLYHCHVFKCPDEDTATKILQSLSKILRKNRKDKQKVLPGNKDAKLDANNLTFKYDITLDILEADGKGMLASVARDKSCFKLRENVPKRIVLCLEQLNNKLLNIERCFGLLLSPGKNVEYQAMHLLEKVQMEARNHGRVNIIYGTWNPTWPDMKVLNKETPKDTRVFISVAIDLVFSDLKEPVRIVKESKVRVFPSNEKFWNPSKPRIHEEYTMDLKENFLESGERFYELDRLISASELSAQSHTKSQETSMLLRKAKKSFLSVSSVGDDDEPVEIMGPEDDEDDEDDEPLLSGSGQIDQECTEEVLSGWSDVLLKWKDYQTRPKQLMQLVRKGVPDPMRGQIWQMLAVTEHDSEVLGNYTALANKVPLSQAPAVGAPQTNSRPETLYEQGQFVCVRGNRNVLFVIASLQEDALVGEKRVRASVYSQDPFNPIIFTENAEKSVEVINILCVITNCHLKNGTLELEEGDLILLLEQLKTLNELITVTEAADLSAKEANADSEQPRTRSSRGRKRRFEEDFYYYE
eukprot:gene16013-17630_t